MLVACSNEGVAFKKAEQSYTIGEYYAEALIINPSLIPDNYFQQFLGVFVGLTVCLSATAS